MTEICREEEKVDWGVGDSSNRKRIIRRYRVVPRFYSIDAHFLALSLNFVFFVWSQKTIAPARSRSAWWSGSLCLLELSSRSCEKLPFVWDYKAKEDEQFLKRKQRSEKESPKKQNQFKLKKFNLIKNEQEKQVYLLGFYFLFFPNCWKLKKGKCWERKEKRKASLIF